LRLIAGQNERLKVLEGAAQRDPSHRPHYHMAQRERADLTTPGTRRPPEPPKPIVKPRAEPAADAPEAGKRVYLNYLRNQADNGRGYAEKADNDAERAKWTEAAKRIDARADTYEVRALSAAPEPKSAKNKTDDMPKEPAPAKAGDAPVDKKDDKPKPKPPTKAATRHRWV